MRTTGLGRGCWRYRPRRCEPQLLTDSVGSVTVEMALARATDHTQTPAVPRGERSGRSGECVEGNLPNPMHLMQYADIDWGPSIFEAAVFGGRATRPVDRCRGVSDHAGNGTVGIVE